MEELNVLAVVDTGADVSIISEHMYRRLKNPPHGSLEVKMHAAGENQTFTAKQIEPVNVRVGQNTLSRMLFVAPIKDDMLLGIDLLRALGAKVDVVNENLECNKQQVPLKRSSRIWDPGTNYSVKLLEKTKIPPNSELVIPIEVNTPVDTCMWLEPKLDLPVLVASSVYGPTEKPLVSLVNTTDKQITLRKGVKVGILHPLKE